MNFPVPNDIVISIFLKLPVKSLVRFRCVSKSLSAAVQSPEFTAAHLSLQKPNRDPLIILKFSRSDFSGGKPYFTTFTAEFRPIENIQMPFLDDQLYDPVVDGPCNGLLLLKCGDRLAFWNPSTREFKLVPPSTIRRPPGIIERTAFNAVGFGFDSRSGEYKVIRFVTNYVPGGMDQINQVEIYSLNSNSWREIPAPKELVNGGCPSFGDFENGFYHWFGAREYKKFIISFDLTNESFTSTALPEFEGFCLWRIIKQLNGAMRLIAFHPLFSEEMVFDIWVKKDRWIKELSMGPFHGVHQPFGSWRNEQMLFQSSRLELLLFDFESREMKNFGVSARNIKGVMYSESLVPINGITEQQEGIAREKCTNYEGTCSYDGPVEFNVLVECGLVL